MNHDQSFANRPPLEPRGRLEFHQALALLLGVMLLVMLIGYPLQAKHFTIGMLITEWGLIALPVWGWVRYRRWPLRRTFALSSAPSGVWLGAIYLALSGWMIVAGWSELQQRLLPVPQEVIDRMHRRLFDSSRPLALDFFSLALSPAICEELLFRGLLFRASLSQLRPSTAIAFNALAFGIFHMSPYRLVPAALPGATLALIVHLGGSILPAMLFHALNNAITLIAGRAFGARQGQIVTVGRFLVACVGFAAGLFSLYRAKVIRPQSRDRGADSDERPHLH